MLNYLKAVWICYRVFIKYCVILKYSGLWLFSVFPGFQCVYTHQEGRTPALAAAKLAEFRKITKI